jgi:hypothetical protein
LPLRLTLRPSGAGAARIVTGRSVSSAAAKKKKAVKVAAKKKEKVEYMRAVPVK